MYYHVHVVVEETGLRGLVVLHTSAVQILGTNKKAHLVRDSRYCSLEIHISRLGSDWSSSYITSLSYCRNFLK